MKESPTTSVQRPANWSCPRLGELGSSTTRPNLTTLTGGSPTLTQARPGLASTARASSRGGFPSSGPREGKKHIKTELKNKPPHAPVRRAIARERRPPACSEAANKVLLRQTHTQNRPAAPEGPASPGSPEPEPSKRRTIVRFPGSVTFTDNPLRVPPASAGSPPVPRQPRPSSLPNERTGPSRPPGSSPMGFFGRSSKSGWTSPVG